MADTTTTTYGLTKIEVGASEDTWGAKLNTNFDSLDDLLDGTTVLTGVSFDDTATLVDNLDNTKVAQFQASGITTGTTRTFTFPDASGTIALTDATLTSIAALGTAGDKGLYFTGVDTAAEFDLTAAGRALLDDADASAQRTTLGLGGLATLDILDDDLATSSATRPPSVDSVVNGIAAADRIKAWVNFNGTGTVAINASYNVSSITDNGTGDYTVNFTSALADANYAVTLTTVGAALGTTTRAFVVAGTDAGGATLKTTTQLRVQRGNSSAVGLIDAAELNVMVMR